MRRAAPWIVLVLLLVFSLFGCSSSRGEIALSMYHWNFELDQDSPIYTVISRKVCVDIIPLSAPWSEWPNKLNVMIASGEVPNIFITYGPGDPDSFERLATWIDVYAQKLGSFSQKQEQELSEFRRNIRSLLAE